jgi:hypothetical protein
MSKEWGPLTGLIGEWQSERSYLGSRADADMIACMV